MGSRSSSLLSASRWGHRYGGPECCCPFAAVEQIGYIAYATAKSRPRCATLCRALPRRLGWRCRRRSETKLRGEGPVVQDLQASDANMDDDTEPRFAGTPRSNRYGGRATRLSPLPFDWSRLDMPEYRSYILEISGSVASEHYDFWQDR